MNAKRIRAKPAPSERFHGRTKTPIYGRWVSMIQRCTNPNDAGWARYGGRGIKVCPRWMRFYNFLTDMGEIPVGKALDRKDNNGNYEPGNCRWVIKKLNDRNTRRTVYMTMDGATKPLREWADELGLNAYTVYCRYKRYGWSAKDALTLPRLYGKSYHDFKQTTIL